MRQPYKTDLTDDQWKLIKPLIPPAKPGGRPREVDMRGGREHPAVPGPNRLPMGAAAARPAPREHRLRLLRFGQWRDDGTWRRIADALRRKVRVEEGRDPTPSAASIDSQSVKTTELGGERGYDAGKKVGGRKRHVVVDTSGLLMAVAVTSASADDGAAAPQVLGHLDRSRFPRPEVVFADRKYKNHALDEWLAIHKKRFRVEVVRRPEGTKGFVLLPKRWVSERGFAWSGRDRRHSKDDEYFTESSESWVRISAIGQMLRRLAPDESRTAAPFKYAKKKAA